MPLLLPLSRLSRVLPFSCGCCIQSQTAAAVLAVWHKGLPGACQVFTVLSPLSSESRCAIAVQKCPCLDSVCVVLVNCHAQGCCPCC